MAPTTRSGGILDPPENDVFLDARQEVASVRVSVKIPPFWPSNPSLWFVQIESNFHMAGVNTEITKYHAVVASMDGNVLSQVSDIVASPPEDEPYQALKKRLIEQYGESDKTRLRKLLQDMVLGDKRPTQLLREMRELAGNRITDDVLMGLWQQRLPPQVNAILSVNEGGLDKMALQADKILEVTLYSENAVHTSSTPSMSDDPLERLERQIAALTSKFEAFSAVGQGRSVNRDGNTKRTRSRSRPKHGGKCFYHFKFGSAARMCVPPCSEASGNARASH